MDVQVCCWIIFKVDCFQGQALRSECCGNTFIWIGLMGILRVVLGLGSGSFTPEYVLAKKSARLASLLGCA